MPKQFHAQIDVPNNSFKADGKQKYWQRTFCQVPKGFIHHDSDLEIFVRSFYDTRETSAYLFILEIKVSFTKTTYVKHDRAL